MTIQSTTSLSDAAGCLGANPSRAGMSAILQRMLLTYAMGGGKVMVFDQRSSGKSSSFASSLNDITKFASFLNDITKERVAKIPVAAKTCAVGEEPPFEKRTDFVAKLALARPFFSPPRRIS